MIRSTVDGGVVKLETGLGRVNPAELGGGNERANDETESESALFYPTLNEQSSHKKTRQCLDVLDC